MYVSIYSKIFQRLTGLDASVMLQPSMKRVVLGPWVNSDGDSIIGSTNKNSTDTSSGFVCWIPATMSATGQQMLEVYDTTTTTNTANTANIEPSGRPSSEQPAVNTRLQQLQRSLIETPGGNYVAVEEDLLVQK